MEAIDNLSPKLDHIGLDSSKSQEPEEPHEPLEPHKGPILPMTEEPGGSFSEARNLTEIDIIHVMIAGTENDRLNRQSLRLDKLTPKARERVILCNIDDFLVRDFTTESVDGIARQVLQELTSTRQEGKSDGLIVIAYGLGALAVKKAICIAGANEEQWPKIFDSATRFVISLYARSEAGGRIHNVFDRYTASIGLPHETLIQERSQNGDEPFPELVFKIFFENDNFIPCPSLAPIERTLMALAPAHRQFSSAHFNPSFPALQTAEFLKWHISNGLRVLYLNGSNDSEVAKAAEQTLLHWALDREAKKIAECKLPFSFVFSSRDPLRCSMKGMLTALWLSHFTSQKNKRNGRHYELMMDQYMLHHAWTESDLFKLFTTRYTRLTGRSPLLLLQNLHECDTESRKAFWELLNAFAAKSETSIKIVVTGKKSTNLLYELHQCNDIPVDICKVAARDGTIREDLGSLITSVCQCKHYNFRIRAKLEELKEMDATKLHAILRLIMDLTGWPQDSSGKSFHDFSSHLQAITISSTRVNILRRTLQSIPDQQGLRWIWSWLSHTQRPLSYEELAMALYLICDEYESRVERSRGRITPPLIADGHDILFYAVNALPFHLSENPIILNKIRDELKATGWGLASWSRAYWAMSNPFSRPKFGTLKSPYETLLKLGNIGIESIAILEGLEGLFNTMTASMDTPTDAMELDCLVAAIREGKEDAALSIAKDLISLSKKDGSFDVSSGCSKIAWPPWFLWRATWLNMDRLVSLLLDDARRGHERSYDSKANMLSVAAACGNIGAAKSLVGKDKSLLEKRVSAATPLVVASSNGNHGMVEFLLELGADPNSGVGPTTRGLWAPLAIAVTFEHAKTMKILLKNKACSMFEDVLVRNSPIMMINGQDPQGLTPLIYASLAGDLPMVEWLLNHGANIDLRDNDSRSPLFHALQTKHEKIVKRLLEWEPSVDVLTCSGQTLFESAMGDVSFVQLLLDAGADPELSGKNGATAINTAAMKGKTSVVKLLVDRKVDIHRPDKYGWSAIMYATGLGSDADLVRILIRGGADLSQSACTKYSGLTPLHVAAIRGHAEIVKVLLEHRKMIDLEKRNRNGETPLMVTEPEECLKLLILAGADINVQDHQGQTVLTRATRGEWPPEIVDLFLSQPDILINEAGKYLGTALIIACRLLKGDVVLNLLKHDADPSVVSEALNCTALVATCMSNEGSVAHRNERKREIVSQLLEYRADVNIMGGHTVYNAICAASLFADSATINLLKKNASLTSPDPIGRLPIHFAAAIGISNFKAIFSEQSDLIACDCAGRNVLHWAAQFGHVKTVEFILEKMDSSDESIDSYIDQADVDGWTPLCWAVRPSVTGFNSENESESPRYTDTVRCLLDYGADHSVTFTVGKGWGGQTFTLPQMAKLCDVDDEMINLLTDDRDSSIQEDRDLNTAIYV
ncbi:hypothetical protein MKX08_005625 [Trichoderma sp. CBMAI-0020]|nr:hypothetical protein MKX08_005625 [Trichoderma sp. CBMAI-0020]